MKKIRMALALMVAGSLLAGCAVYKPTIPSGYKGPRASIKDSFKTYGTSKADMFYVAQVNGSDVENTRIKTQKANAGRGMLMRPVPVMHEVPAARSVTLNIVGRTQHAAPVLELTNAVYEVKGTIEFIPEAGKTYAIRGELGDGGSSVWIEQDATHAIVGKKIEANGSGKVSMLAQ